MKGTRGTPDHLLTAFLSVPYTFSSVRNVYAESLFVTYILKAVSNVSDSIITILLVLIVLATAVSLVRSGLNAQISTQLQRRFGLSREMIMVLETVTIFVLAMIALPALRNIMKAATAKAGSQSEMLGGSFHLPDY